jgi:digeranylgeranylglycerophospholipid reductase
MAVAGGHRLAAKTQTDRGILVSKQDAQPAAAYDIVIVGAGLAGLSAATTIARESDASVGLIERRAIGSNNPTPLTFVDVVERFGLEAHVQGCYRRFVFHSPLGNVSSHDYTGTPLVALHYKDACETLFRRSQATGNVSFIRTKVQETRRSADGRWRVRLAQDKEISTSLIIDASGRKLLTTHTLSLPGPGMYSHCFGQTLANCNVPNPEEVIFLAPSDRFGDGGGWLYPLVGGRASFGYATLSTSVDCPGALVKTRYQRAVQEFSPYSEWLAGSQVDHIEAGTIPICPPRRLVYDGLMLIGDAAGLATIWSCMGSEPALVSGELAGQAAIRAHWAGDYSATKLQNYQKQWFQEYGRIYRQGTLLAPASWRQGEINWNRQIPLVQQLTPEQMLARLRSNWPPLPWWKIAFIRAYDWAGRTRRSIVAHLNSSRSQKGTGDEKIDS